MPAVIFDSIHWDSDYIELISLLEYRLDIPFADGRFAMKIVIT